ncbi:MAG: S41 family peptidase [Oscillospiraceae bacterium]|nr:S41 family peptidase [Oscillospiraceae bacterium]
MKKATCFLTLLIAITLLVACNRQTNPTNEPAENDNEVSSETATYVETVTVVEPIVQLRTEAERDENLEKLGKVWGFVKYTHNSFITGEKCWDEELLRLIPMIYDAYLDDVNGILYDWFVGLGDDGYDFEYGHDFDFLNYMDTWMSELVELEFFNNQHGLPEDDLTEYRKIAELFNSMLEGGYNLNWQSFEALVVGNFPESPLAISTARDFDMRPMADLSWINYGYLGALATHLLRFDGISTLDRASAPVSFNLGTGIPYFLNQSHHRGMDFSDTGYRLLGLFRLWNSMNYYYPHLGILDVEWNDLLLLYIPKMLEGGDRFSYELTLAMLARHLRDSAHLNFVGTTFFGDKFGQWVAPARLRAAEGRLVVYNADDIQHPNISLRHLTIPNLFEKGDVILSVDGRDIGEIAAEMLQILPYPNEEKALDFLALHQPLRTRTPHMGSVEITVLRDDEEITLDIQTLVNWMGQPRPAAMQSHVLLDNNIGLINPAIQSSGTARHVMEEFATTDGIIIDLRQYPNWSFFFEMRGYLMEEAMPFVYASVPVHTHPGMRVYTLLSQVISQSPYTFIYDRPVVLLMDERSISRPEWVIMAYRIAPNVTVIGLPSMGSNGDISTLPLPGGITMSFTGVGVYTPEGGQTHRVGLAPDIRVDRTIQGIAEGRDEIMEAAVRFILGEN